MLESICDCIEPFETAFEENANMGVGVADVSIDIVPNVNDALDVVDHSVDLTMDTGADDLFNGNVPDQVCLDCHGHVEGDLNMPNMMSQGADEMQSDNSHIDFADEDSKGGNCISFGGRRDDILKEIQQAKSDIDYYSKEVARLTQEKSEGWIVDSILFDRQSALSSAQSKLRDLERELSSVRD